MKLSKMMVFRLSFFGAFFVDGTLFLMQLLLYQAIYSQVDTIGEWERGEMIIFIGTFSLINALNMVIFFFGTNDIGVKIKNGDLDHYLTKPVNPLLRLSLENVNRFNPFDICQHHNHFYMVLIILRSLLLLENSLLISYLSY